jgi:hypothetical protein
MLIRLAELFMRSMCFWGRNRRTFPSTPRKALRPSNTAWA